MYTRGATLRHGVAAPAHRVRHIAGHDFMTEKAAMDYLAHIPASQLPSLFDDFKRATPFAPRGGNARRRVPVDLRGAGASRVENFFSRLTQVQRRSASTLPSPRTNRVPSLSMPRLGGLVPVTTRLPSAMFTPARIYADVSPARFAVTNPCSKVCCTLSAAVRSSAMGYPRAPSSAPSSLYFFSMLPLTRRAPVLPVQ